MPTKQERECMSFSELNAVLRRVAENPSANSVEANQARGLQNEITELPKASNGPHPVLSSKTISEAKHESLKRSVVDFLLATMPLHKVASGR